MTFELNLHVHRLLMDEPFFAALSRRIDKRESKSIPTAGVRVNPHTNRYEMLFNADFMAKLSDAELSDVLKHELYHLVFLHVTSRKPEGANEKTWNVAADLAINSHLNNLPDWVCKPGIGPFAEYESFLSAEAYFEMLKQDPNFDPSEGGGQGGEGDPNGQLDSHDGWSEGGEAGEEIAKERLKNDIKKAAVEASESNNWGSISHDVRKDIMSRIQTKVDWRKVLRYFIKTSQKAAKQSSIKHINKRYPYIHAGKKTSRTAKIAISIDQSGSVSDEMLNAFFNELNKLAKYAEFTVVPFDTDVFEDKVYTWKKGENRKWDRVLSGGTCFDAPTEYVNKRSFDGHILLTDLCAPKPKPSKCQRMWMTTSYYAERPYFTTGEKVIAID